MFHNKSLLNQLFVQSRVSDVLGVVIFENAFNQLDKVLQRKRRQTMQGNSSTEELLYQPITKRNTILSSSNKGHEGVGDKDMNTPIELVYKIRFQSWPRNAGAGNNEASLSPRDFEWKTADLAPMMERNGPRERGSSDGGPPGKC